MGGKEKVSENESMIFPKSVPDIPDTFYTLFYTQNLPTPQIMEETQ